MPTINKMIPAMKIILALILSVIGIAVSVKLKSLGEISEVSLLVLIAFSILTGLFIAYSEKIKSLDFKSLTVTLKEIKDTEESVKQIASAIIDVIEANSDAIMSESYDDDKASKAMQRLKDLIA